MSELDKYSKYDPLAQHSSYAKKSKITVADTDAWLKKHGNSMDRLKKTEKTSVGNIWSTAINAHEKTQTIAVVWVLVLLILSLA